jgi:HSP20 family protein
MLIRFDPFRELDRLTQEGWGSSGQNAATVPARIPLDAVRRGDKVVLSFDLPGIDPDSLDVEVEKNVLTVSADRPAASDGREGDEVLVRERRWGRFTRQLALGDNLDTDRLEANLHDGVLTVTVPVAEQARSRKVAVGHRAPAQAIEADASSN